jgi:hypothetical protein
MLDPERFDLSFETNLEQPKLFDMGLPPGSEQNLHAWFHETDWDRSAEVKLPDIALKTIKYFGLIEGNVCKTYVRLASASKAIREKTDYTDFSAWAWPGDENGHSIALFRFLDQYHGRTASTRQKELDDKFNNQSKKEKLGIAALQLAGVVAPRTYAAVYAVRGYYNESVTLAGYGSLLGKVNEVSNRQIGEPHPVLDKIFRSVMKEERNHRNSYRPMAERFLSESSIHQTAARKSLEVMPGLVGENFGGGREADEVLLYLFKDIRGRELAEKIDHKMSSLPGLAGVTPTQNRVEQALKNLEIDQSNF